VRQPKYQLGQTAAKLLLGEAGRPAQHEHRRIVFTPDLITRASSRPDTIRLAAPHPVIAIPSPEDR
jgi:LacI family transcriptional regulator